MILEIASFLKFLKTPFLALHNFIHIWNGACQGRRLIPIEFDTFNWNFLFFCNSLFRRQPSERVLNVQKHRERSGTRLTVHGFKRNRGNTVELVGRMSGIRVFQDWRRVRISSIFDLKHNLWSFHDSDAKSIRQVHGKT